MRVVGLIGRVPLVENIQYIEEVIRLSREE
jgi:hypothetical protein